MITANGPNSSDVRSPDANPLTGIVGPRAAVPELLQARRTRSAHQPFVVWEGQVFSYEDAWHMSCEFAAWLSARGGSMSETRVASFLGNSPRAIWAWLGTLFAGGIYVPLNRQQRGRLLTEMLRRSGAAVLVTDSAGLAEIADIGSTSVRTVVLLDTPPRGTGAIECIVWDDLADLGRNFTPPAIPPSSVAEIIYTSGTTGRSKAVAVTHNQLCRGAGWVAWAAELTAADVFHQWMPLYHIAAQLDAALATVIAGGTLALFPTFSRSSFWSQVSDTRATAFMGTSSTVQMIWDLPADHSDAETSLRVGVIGAIPVQIHRGFEERFGTRLIEAYGMTEAEPIVMPVPGTEFPLGTMGKPTPDFEVAVVDECDLPVPVGEAGEIVCRPRVPDVITPGYEGDPEATLELFRNCWLHTGDIGRIDADGFVSFVDRKKHAIRRRGENISSWELENLLSDHPAVAEACAVGVPSPFGGDEVKVIVVAVNGATIDEAELREWCAGHMAKFMVPRFIEVRESLPRNSVGRVQKHLLTDVGGAVWDADNCP